MRHLIGPLFASFLISTAFAAETGYIQIKAPPGIMIFLDGDLKGKTTAEQDGRILEDVPVGRHELKALKAGANPKTKVIEVKKADDVVVWVVGLLAPKIMVVESGETEKGGYQAVGNLQIKSVPIDMKISIPSLAINYSKKKQDVKFLEILAGEYLATFSGLGKSISSKITIYDKVTTEVFVNLLKGDVQNKTEEERRLAAIKAEEERKRKERMAREAEEERRLAAIKAEEERKRKERMAREAVEERRLAMIRAEEERRLAMIRAEEERKRQEKMARKAEEERKRKEELARIKAEQEREELARIEAERQKPITERVAPLIERRVNFVTDQNLEMIWVKPGQFQMGSPAGKVVKKKAAGRFLRKSTFVEKTMGGEKHRDKDEVLHDVTLTQGFYLGKYEVTQAQWMRVMGSNPSKFKRADRPVEGVSWNDATQFCKKLTEREKKAGRVPEGMAYQLPTEAQWEYACRAGTTTAYSWGDSIISSNASYERNRDDGTTLVGKYPPNQWGFHDMHGNVWEWTADWLGDYPSGAVTNPEGSASGSSRVLRGGSWGSFGTSLRSAGRLSSTPSSRRSDLGFRVGFQKQ